MGENKRLITVSEMRSFKACPRKYMHRYVQLRRPHADADTLTFGKAVHSCLAASRLEPSAMLHYAAKAADEIENPYEAARATAMLIGHMHRWGTGGLKTIDVNVRFKVPLVNPESGRQSNTWLLAGEMDAIVESDGTVVPQGRYVMEDKTSSQDISAGSVYWRRLQLDVQVSTYYAADGESVGVLYNVLGKPGVRPLKATPEDKRKYTAKGWLYKGQRLEDESVDEYRERCGMKIGEDPDKYYQRHVIYRTKADDMEAAYDAWNTAKMIRNCELTGMWPRNDNSCFNYNRECEYFDVCTGVTDIDNDLKFRTAKAKHEELE